MQNWGKPLLLSKPVYLQPFLLERIHETMFWSHCRPVSYDNYMNGLLHPYAFGVLQITSIHLQKNQCWCVMFFSAINYKLRNSIFSTYLNHYSLDHQYKYSLPLNYHCLKNYTPLEMMIKMLRMVLRYQDQRMILLWISLSFWNSRKRFHSWFVTICKMK